MAGHRSPLSDGARTASWLLQIGWQEAGQGWHHGNAPLSGLPGMHGNDHPCLALLTIAAVRFWPCFALASGFADRQV